MDICKVCGKSILPGKGIDQTDGNTICYECIDEKEKDVEEVTDEIIVETQTSFVPVQTGKAISNTYGTDDDYSIKDSGERRNFETGAVRDINTNKGRFDLLPTRAIAKLAIHFQKGCAKYGDRNWEKGQPLSVYYDSAARHLNKYLQGMDDEDHLVSALWNIACAVDTRERIIEGILPRELDDLPLKSIKE